MTRRWRTDDGTIITHNPLPRNVRSSIRVNREFDSIVTDTSDVQQQKQRCPIASTDDRIIMAVNPPSENARDSIRVNREFDSIVTDTSDWQYIKQLRPITSTDDGIIDLSIHFRKYSLFKSPQLRDPFNCNRYKSHA
jgi:hypothetical protein